MSKKQHLPVCPVCGGAGQQRVWQDMEMQNQQRQSLRRQRNNEIEHLQDSRLTGLICTACGYTQTFLHPEDYFATAH